VARMKRLEDIMHRRDVVFCGLVRRMLEFDPKRRISAAEAVNHPFFSAIRGKFKVPIPVDASSS